MPGTKDDYISYRVEKSKEIYNDAILLAQNSRWNSCVNRLYHSSYYLVSALLYKNEIKSETHNGTKTQFFLHFIKTNVTSRDNGKLYSHLFDWRQESDYADFVEFDEKTVVPLLGQVEKLNKDLELLLKSAKT